MAKNGYRSTLNIAEEFSGSTFFLTGATGAARRLQLCVLSIDVGIDMQRA